MENPEEPIRKEGDIERDKAAFLEAVSSTEIQELPAIFDGEAVEKLKGSMADAKLFLLGEMHGVKENTDIIYTLFKKFGFRRLALEWKPELKVVAEDFLRSGQLAFDAIKDSPDGRITAGHFALLKKLKDEGMLDELVCFDGGATDKSWNARDAAMAKNILVSLSDSPILAVAGNLHTKTEPITFGDEPGEHHPMGENVQKEIADVATGEIEYISGQFHNYGTKDFKKHSEEPTGPRFYQNEHGLYIFELPEAHTAVVPNPEERLKDQQ
jgi:hypothetical protein